MTKVTQEVAQAEITSWLDKKRIFKNYREQNKISIETLVDAMCEGVLVQDSNGYLIQTLMFPLGEKGVTTELKWAPRLTQKMQNPHMKGVDVQDIEGRFAAMTAALTDTTKSHYMEMESADSRVAKAILVFFL